MPKFVLMANYPTNAAGIFRSDEYPLLRPNNQASRSILKKNNHESTMSPKRPSPHHQTPVPQSQKTSFGSPPLQRLMTSHPLKDPEVQRYVLLVVSLFLGVSTGFFMWLHHRNRLMPPSDRRHDITELYLAPAELLCPGLPKEPHRKALEICISGLSLPPQGDGALKKVVIPKLEETPLQSYPRLIDLFAAQGLEDYKKAFLKAQDFIVGVQVPFGFFTPDSANTDPFTLVMAQVRRGRFCYLGQCPFHHDRHAYVAVGPMLFDFYNELAQKGVPQSTLIPVWIYLTDLTSTIGINLEHGIFVARSSDLRAARFIHGPLVQGLAFISAFSALGITLMALVFAWSRKRYLDTAAFVALACMLYLNTLIEPYLFSFGNLPIDPQVRGTIVSLGEIQLLIAGIFFGWSTSRPPPRTFWLSYTFATSCALIVAPLLLASLNADFTRDYLPLVLSIMQFILPPLVSVTSWRLQSNSADQPLKLSSRRLQEQALFASALGLLGLIPLLEEIQKLQGLSTYPIISLRGLALIPIFGVLLYVAFGKKTVSSRQGETSPGLEVDVQKNPARISFKTEFEDAMGLIDLIAHDVRKPFSMIKAGLNVIGSQALPVSPLGKTLDGLSQEVHRSLTEVDGLLREVMRFKRFSSSNPFERGVSPSLSLKMALREALHEVFKFDSSLQYTFVFSGKDDSTIAGNHSDFVISISTLLRILIPLGHNDQKEGALYFETAPSLQDSSLPPQKTRGSLGFSFWILTPKKVPESEQKLFSFPHPIKPASKTKLRLRNAHGDLIRFGHKIQGINTHMTGTDQYRLGWALDLRLDETSALSQVSHTTPAASSESLRPWPKSSLDLGVKPKSSAPISIHGTIVIVDDEPIYSAAVHQQILAESGTHTGLNILCFTSPDEAWEYVTSHAVSLVICDIDFTNTVVPSHNALRDGIEFTANLKNRFPHIMAILHSNRSLNADHPDVIRSKADYFVVKPMTLKDLRQFIAFPSRESVESSSPSIPKSQEPLPSHPPAQNTASVVAIVDDDIFIREAWVQKMRDRPTLSFPSVEGMLVHLNENPTATDQIALVILDQYLEGGMMGLEFAALIRRGETPLPSGIPLVLASDAYDSIEKDPQKRSLVDLVLSKDPIGYQELLARISRHTRDRSTP